MKRSILSLVLLLVITLLGIAISVPTFEINFREKVYTIRGLDPKDIDPTFIKEEFKIRRSLDLHGGNMASYQVDLSTLAPEEREAAFEEVYATLSRRMGNLGTGDFQISRLVNIENNDYRIIIQYAEEVPTDIMTALGGRGELSIWTYDFASLQTPEGEETEDPMAGTLFEGRIQSSLTNSDVRFAQVVSDARIYLSPELANYNTSLNSESLGIPANFGLQLEFKEESAVAFSEALSTNSYGIFPLLLAVDGEAIGLQASGYTYNVATPTNDLFVYTSAPDQSIYNQFFAAYINTTPVDFPVNLIEISPLYPTLGIDSQRNLFIGIGIGIIAFCIFAFYQYGKKSAFIIISIGIYIIWFITLLKIFNFASAALSLALVSGAILSLIVFLIFKILLVERIAQESQNGITPEELKSAYLVSRNDFRNILFFFIFLAYVLQLFGTREVNQFASGMGFGVITGLLVFLFSTKTLLPFLFLKKKRK